MSTLANNAGWEEIDFDTSGLQENVLRDPKGVGERFNVFLRQGCRFNFVDPISIPTKSLLSLGT